MKIDAYKVLLIGSALTGVIMLGGLLFSIGKTPPDTITEELYINDAGDVCTVYQVNDRAIGIECEKEASEQ